MNILTGRSLSALILCLWSLGMAAQETTGIELGQTGFARLKCSYGFPINVLL